VAYRLILNIFQLSSDIDNEEGQEEAASYPITAEAATDLDNLAAKTEDERAENTGFENFFRLH